MVVVVVVVVAVVAVVLKLTGKLSSSHVDRSRRVEDPDFPVFPLRSPPHDKARVEGCTGARRVSGHFK